MSAVARKRCPEDGCHAAPADQRDGSKEGRCLRHRDEAAALPNRAPRKSKAKPAEDDVLYLT